MKLIPFEPRTCERVHQPHGQLLVRADHGRLPRPAKHERHGRPHSRVRAADQFL